MRTIYRCNILGNVPRVRCQNIKNHESCPLNESEKSAEYMDSLDKNFYAWMALRFVPDTTPKLKRFSLRRDKKNGNIMPRITRTY